MGALPKTFLVIVALFATRADAETINGVVSRYSWIPAIGAQPGGPEVGLASRAVTLTTWTKEEIGACSTTCAAGDWTCRRCGWLCSWHQRSTQSTTTAA